MQLKKKIFRLNNKKNINIPFLLICFNRAKNLKKKLNTFNEFNYTIA